MDFGESVRVARRAMGLTQDGLAHAAGVSRHTVLLLEQGGGRMAALQQVAPHILFRITGLASGDDPHEQVRRARQQRGLTQSELARKAGVSVPTVRTVEKGTASMSSLSKIVSVLAPNAKMTTPFRAHWKLKKDVRLTPPHLLDMVVEAFGPVSIDPAGHPNSFVDADITLTEFEDGLTTRWTGRSAFVNPPFSDLTRWMRRCAEAWANEEVKQIVALFPARTETGVFREQIFGVADVFLLPRRLAFHDDTRAKLDPAPFALMLCVWGADQAAVAHFADVSEALVLWSTRNSASR
jgi:DNA-binding XRE family transcriptional regulator